MKTILLCALLVIHGLIHLMGFVKAFQLAEIKELQLPISKPFGAAWLLTSILFVAAAVGCALEISYWLLMLLAAVLLSQFLVFKYWNDAKYGTLINVLLTVFLTVSFFF